MTFLPLSSSFLLSLLFPLLSSLLSSSFFFPLLSSLLFFHHHQFQICSISTTIFSSCLPLPPSFLLSLIFSIEAELLIPKTLLPPTLLLHRSLQLFFSIEAFTVNPSPHLSSASVCKCQQVTPVQGTRMDLITVISKLPVECSHCAVVSCPWSSTFPTQVRILDVGFGSVVIG
jgi:hypothetical protein